MNVYRILAISIVSKADLETKSVFVIFINERCQRQRPFFDKLVNGWLLKFLCSRKTNKCKPKSTFKRTWLSPEAKVPLAAKRSTCTLSTLYDLRAAIDEQAQRFAERTMSGEARDSDAPKGQPQEPFGSKGH